MTNLNVNLLINPDAEASQGAIDFGSVAAPVGWTITSNFSAVAYTAGGSVDLNTEDSSSINGGNHYFAGAVSNSLATATQRIDFSDLAAQIDSSLFQANLTGFLGGWSGQGDNLVVSATFYNSSQTVLSSFSIGPVSNIERNSISKLLFRSATVGVPVGARSVVITLTASRQEGSYNDGYADNLSFQIIGAGCIQGTPGNDFLNGDQSESSINDCIDGLAGDDILNGLTGNDQLAGGDGNDSLDGGSGDDTILGGNGNDILTGNAGNDMLMDGDGNDRISGGEGNDRINSGLGKDQIILGRGHDICEVSLGLGFDVIKDFRDRQDRIDLPNNIRVRDLSITQRGSNTLISIGADQLAVLVNTRASVITAVDFV